MATQVAQLVIAVGLSLLAGYLLQKKNKNQARDDRPTTLAQRGAFLPRIIGKRRVGVLFAWAGNRLHTREKAPGSKGGGFFGGGQKVDVWLESGIHMLCIGPVKTLWEIEIGGEVILTGPVTPENFPSGSLVWTDDKLHGALYVHWGEIDQTASNFVKGYTGVDAGYPATCYIEWRNYKLGQTPTWPVMTYVVECGIQEVHLTRTEPYMEPSRQLHGPSIDIESVVSGPEGNGFIRVLGRAKNTWTPRSLVRLRDNGAADQDLTILFSTHTAIQTGSKSWDFTDYTDIYIAGGTDGIAGLNNAGSLKLYTEAEDDGYNPAHIIAELLFSRWPWGIGADKSRFDMESLEQLGELMVTEGIRGSIDVRDGEDLRSVLGGILQDLGVMLPIDPTTGLLKFVPIREPQPGETVHIGGDMLVEAPETEILHGPRHSDRVVFTFIDRQNRFKETPIQIDDDGQALVGEYYRARKVPIVVTTNYGSSATIAERRSQEELAGGGELKIVANRSARLLYPGTPVTVEGFDQVYRVMNVKPDPLSGNVDLSLINDFYGVKASDFIPNTDGTNNGEPTTPAEHDLRYQIVELPEILTGSTQRVFVARIRAHDAVEGASVLISRDDTTYSTIGVDRSQMQGGLLDADLPADELYYLEQGPTITALGPDMANVLDLTGDDISWRNGRQVVVINGEVFFLKKATALGGDSWRLDGLLRARFDTRPQDHEAGDAVYIIQDDDGLFTDDVLLEPEVTLYAKTVPFGYGSTDVTEAVVVETELYGKGVRPVPVSDVALDISAGTAGLDRHSYVGGDLPIRWSYSTPQTTGSGAGQSGAGTPQSDATAEGDFLVEILHATTNAVMRVEVTSTNGYTYTSADRVSDFGGDPAGGFKVRVTQLRGGFSADPVTETIARVA